ncbi:hypothetical protein NC651_007111, partial [Populus alba x Populus x berolinensis]
HRGSATGWREEGKAKERVLHKGNIESEDALSNEHINGVSPFTDGGDQVAYVFNSQNLISLSRPGLENFARLQNRTEPWFVVFDAPWRRFSR